MENLPAYEEGMDCGMPPYKKDGVVEVGSAGQKNSISIYGLKSDALEAPRAEFAGASIGEGCTRYTKPEKVDLEADARLLKAMAASSGKVC